MPRRGTFFAGIRRARASRSFVPLYACYGPPPVPWNRSVDTPSTRAPRSPAVTETHGKSSSRISTPALRGSVCTSSHLCSTKRLHPPGEWYEPVLGGPSRVTGATQVYLLQLAYFTGRPITGDWYVSTFCSDGLGGRLAEVTPPGDVYYGISGTCGGTGETRE